jgi:type VI secretion system secreted protein Hcp
MAVDMFLKLDGIDGESTKSKNEGWIELHSWSFGATNHSASAHGSGMGTGKAEFAPITIQKTVDKASPKLFLNCCQGSHIKTASLQVKESTGGKTTETYLQYDLEKVKVDSITWGGQGATPEKPSEQISLSFQKITVSYWPQKPDGTLGAKIPAGWDVSKNEKV